MSEEQIYNPIEIINRMINDIEGMLNPIVVKMQFLFSIMSYINLGLVIGVFTLLLFYMVFVRHHHIKRKLKKPTNYFITLLIPAIIFIFYELVRIFYYIKIEKD